MIKSVITLTVFYMAVFIGGCVDVCFGETELRQNTATTVKLGSMVNKNDTDGTVPLVLPSLPSFEIYLAKENQGAFAVKHSAGAVTFDYDGWYDCPLDACDTNTLGWLYIDVNDNNATIVSRDFRNFKVIDANSYDASHGGYARDINTSQIAAALAGVEVKLAAQAFADVNFNDPNTDPNSWTGVDWLVYSMKCNWGNQTVLNKTTPQIFTIFKVDGATPLVMRDVSQADNNDSISRVRTP